MDTRIAPPVVEHRAPFLSCVLPTVATGLVAALDLVQWGWRSLPRGSQDHLTPNDQAVIARYALVDETLRQCIQGSGNAVAVAQVLAANQRQCAYESSFPGGLAAEQYRVFIAAEMLLRMVGYLG